MTAKRWIVLCIVAGIILMASASLALAEAQTGPLLQPSEPPYPGEATAANSSTDFQMTFSADKDSFVRQDTPDTNYGDETFLRAGVNMMPADQYQTLLQFDVSDLPDNAHIVSATLKLYATGSASGFRAYAVTEDWAEMAVTWNNKPLAETTGASAFAIGPGWAKWSVANAVQGWITGTNHGLLVKQGNSLFGTVDFSARGETNSPQLIVTYATQGSPMMLPAVADTWINESLPSSNYGDWSDLQVGRDSITLDDYQTLLKFDSSVLPADIVVLSATLEMYNYVGRSPAAEQNETLAIDIWSKAIHTDWDEMTVTWNNRPASSSQGDPSAAYVVSGWTRWDVTNIVQGWASGTLVDYGILLNLDAAQTFNAYFHTRAETNPPRLTIYYEPAPPVCDALTGGSISGPTKGSTGTSYAFNGALLPTGATPPFTYTWHATDQSAVVTTISGTHHSITHTWNTTGTKLVRLTAENCGDTVIVHHYIKIEEPPSSCAVHMAGLSVGGPTTGITATSYAFTATVSPSSATPPFTYTWQATGQGSSGQQGTFTQTTATFTWDDVGTQRITVTAENCGGTFVTIHTLDVLALSQLPDLAVTSAWYESDYPRIRYVIQNVGGGTALADHVTDLYRAVNPVGQDTITETLLPGAIRAGYIDYEWQCSPPATLSVIQVCADGKDVVGEGDEVNNCWDNLWSCDLTFPEIISGPTVLTTTEHTAIIAWETDEPCRSRVDYNRSYYMPQSEIDNTYKTVHQAALSGLENGRSYYFQVFITDTVGHEVNSNDAFFETQAPGFDPPEIESMYLDVGAWGFYEYFRPRLYMVDTEGVDRVEFYFDGVSIGADYEPAVYDVFVSPYDQGMTREDFFAQSHTLVARAYSLGGASTALTQTVIPTVLPVPYAMDMSSPAQGQVIYIPDSIVPAGTDLHVGIGAREFEWGCRWPGQTSSVPPGAAHIAVSCGDVQQSVQKMDVLLDDVEVASQFISPGAYENLFYVDIGGEAAGTHTVEARVHLSDGSTGSMEQTFTLSVGEPSLNLRRKVTRVDNYFQVELGIENEAEATYSAQIDRLYDHVEGFQVINKGTQLGRDAAAIYYDIESFSYCSGKLAISIDLYGPDDTVTLAPGEVFTVEYTLVPFMTEGALDYNVGGAGTHVELDGGTEILYASSGSLDYEVSVALSMADYLIVTNPERMSQFNTVDAEVHDLLSTMAKLASLKDGALGYLSTVTRNTLNDLVDPGGAWAEALYYKFTITRGGYLLIVGEAEIVPSWYTSNIDTSWESSDVDYVHYSDHWYSDTHGGHASDLIVGRVIGNTAIDMRNTIQNSINVHEGRWQFDRSHALLVSGTGNQMSSFRGNVNALANDLSPEWSVTKIHWLDYRFRKTSQFPLIVPFYQTPPYYYGFAGGDVIGGGREETVVAKDHDNHIYILDGDANVLGGFDTGVGGGDDLAVGDVGWGSEDEIIVGRAGFGRIDVFDASGTSLLSIPSAFTSGDDLDVGNMDGSGKDEIFVANAATGNVSVYDDDGDLVATWTAPNYAVEDDFAVGDVMDGGLNNLEAEIVIGDVSDDVLRVYNQAGQITSLDRSLDDGDYLVVGEVGWSDHEEIILGHLGLGAFGVATDRSVYIYDVNTDVITDIFVSQRNVFYVKFNLYDRLAVVDVIDGDEGEILHGGTNGGLIHVCDTHSPAYARGAFKDQTLDQDLIYFSGHGNVGSWAPALRTGNFPLQFGNTAPFVFAPSCLTGNYETGDDNSIAEAFLASDAAVYIGATEVSAIDHNLEAGEWFFDHWGDTESIGSAFVQLEREVWNWDDWYSEMGEFWVYEYNLYGDPKFGAVGSTIETDVQPKRSAETASSFQLDGSTLQIQVPDYEVTDIDGFDHVDIPGGRLLLGSGKYRIPYWTVSIDYPRGVRVRDVVLTDRSGLTVTTGLHIPTTTVTHQGTNNLARSAIPSAVEDEWRPDLEETYSWTLIENSDGGTTLELGMLPFYYNPASTDVRFYRDFDFEIQTVASTVELVSLTTDQSVYVQGDPVSITLVLSNSVDAQDVIVNAVVKAFPDRPVAGLPLRNLHDVSGMAFWTLEWDSSGIAPGDYYVEVELRNSQGDVIDTDSERFGLGIVSGEVSAINATPGMFEAGETIDVSLVFSNTGSVPITGTAIFQVQPTDSLTITALLTQTVAGLAPASATTIDDTWVTSSTVAGNYRILGYVMYDAMTTDPRSIVVGTENLIYLPLVVREL